MLSPFPHERIAYAGTFYNLSNILLVKVYVSGRHYEKENFTFTHFEYAFFHSHNRAFLVHLY